MLIINDLSGNPYATTATFTTNKTRNGDIILTAEIYEIHGANLIDIDRMWTITHDRIEYLVLFVERITEGDSFYIEIKAVTRMLYELSNGIIHEQTKATMELSTTFGKIFEGTSFKLVVAASTSSFTYEEFGNGAYKLDEFKKALDNYGCEFEIVDNLVYIRDKIGSDTNYVYKRKLNASDVKQAIDASSIKTYIRGYANYNESKTHYTKALIKREYTSPLAALLGVNPEKEPIKLPKLKDQAKLDAMLKKAVNESMIISFEANLHDLRANGSTTNVPKLGDRTFLLDDSLDLKTEIRVESIEESYDINGDLIDCKITFGSPNIRQRQAAKVSSLNGVVRDIIQGRRQLSFAVLDDVSKAMVTTIQNVTSDLIFDENGITAIDRMNSNLFMRLNSAGMYLSEDGGLTGRTAITARGITADAITTGTMIADRIMGGVLKDFFGNFEWNLGTGRFYIGNSTLVYRNSGNAAVYGSAGYVAGTLFSNEDGTNYPSIVIGTSPNIGTTQDPRMDPNHAGFAGVRAFSNPSTGDSVELIGDTIEFRNRAGKVSKEKAMFTFKNGGVELGSANTNKFTIKATHLNGMRVYSNALTSLDGKNGISFGSNGELIFLVNGKSYGAIDVINNANFT
ncbi:phage tail protein [Macrococcus armenti]|uniref:phage tail protein n=1 Tax=Macrococcus armenti TaxID=2875764 RepID=UPI001CC93EBF|nr:phage tail protein [Macrococcus armenti]UBH21867.1 phage tail protein [Macrococcus armenti]